MQGDVIYCCFLFSYLQISHTGDMCVQPKSICGKEKKYNPEQWHKVKVTSYSLHVVITPETICNFGYVPVH